MGRPISEVSKVRIRGPLAEFAPLVTAEARQCWLYAADNGERAAADGESEPVDGSTRHGRGGPEPGAGTGVHSGPARGGPPVGPVAAEPGPGPGGAGRRWGAGRRFASRAGVGAGAAAGRVRGVPAVRAGAGGRDGGAYLARARRFLAGRGGSLDGLTAADVTAAVLAEAERVSAGSAQYFVAALRAFLRFCYLDGHTAADLAWAAQAVTGRRRSALPKGISRAEARALLASCDRRRAAGPPGLRRAGDPAAAGPARRRGRGADARGHRLAHGGGHGARQGQPP